MGKGLPRKGGAVKGILIVKSEIIKGCPLLNKAITISNQHFTGFLREKLYKG